MLNRELLKIRDYEDQKNETHWILYCNHDNCNKLF